MIKDLTFVSKCVSCLVCARRCVCVFSKLLHRPLRWRPGEGKLDGAGARSVLQSFPPSTDLGTGHMWKTSSPPARLLPKN